MTMDEDQGRVSDEPGEDHTSISEEDLGVFLKRLADEERAISYRQRVMRGRIGVIRAEPVRHGGLSLSPQEALACSGEGRSGEGF